MAWWQRNTTALIGTGVFTSAFGWLGRCVHSEVGASLVHVFLAKGATKKVRGVTDQGLPPPHLKLVGVLGGGLMGSGIATTLAISGAQVLLKEINPQFMQVRGFAPARPSVVIEVERDVRVRRFAEPLVRHLEGGRW